MSNQRREHGWRLPARSARKRFVEYACLLALAGVMTGATAPSALSAKQSSKTLTKVRMAEAPGLGTSWVPIAQAAGIFKKNGLDVANTPVTNIGVLPAAAVSGQYDVVESVGPLFLNAYIQNVPVVVVAGGQTDSAKVPALGMFVSSSSHIATASQMEEQTVGLASIVGNYADCFGYWMYTHGAHFEAVHLRQVPLASMQAQLAAGQIQVATVPEPWLDQMKQAGYVDLGDPCASMGISNPPQVGAFQIASRTWAASHQSAIGAIQESITETNVWIRAHPEKAAQIISKYSGVPLASVSRVFPQFTARESRGDLYRWIRAEIALGLKHTSPDLSKALVGPKTK